MTVKYTQKVASQRGFGSFAKLLLRWRGTLYKMVWQDVLVYLILYYGISLVYRLALEGESKKTFEKLVLTCARFRDLIPVSFVLGFYVSLVVDRWWGTYKSIPWPDTTAILVATYIKGQDPEARLIRTTILRYVNLAIAMTFSMISPGVKDRLPTLQHFAGAGYLTDSELKILEELESRVGVHKAYVPTLWACKLVEKARKEGRIRTDGLEKVIVEAILNVRGKCGELMGWNEHNIPLVYTQVVTIAVYSFYVFSLLGEQILDPSQGYDGHTIDIYFPIFGILQLMVYVGWIKVAEALLNPFGDDDHDFEFVPLLERHLKMSNLLGNTEESELPYLIQEPPENNAATHNSRLIESGDFLRTTSFQTIDSCN
ncbi:bestrophin-2-like [Macrobrachium rosenbergii]|uniref:bestrophin-2-like n=1 Tax=Macrobrachium rosenbergii TaxID=79674 RepID=UPI0034D73F22